jgi:N-dimethylarginine dimethylaminohydrolase
MAVPFEKPTILMCPPDFYGIEYEINPWMNRGRQSDPAASQSQWRDLYELLRSAGAEIRLMTPVEGLPDLVFTANAGLIWRDKVLLSRFRHQARQSETPVDDAWFQANGFEPISLPEYWSFEGAGDALFCGETLFAGYLIRSDASAMQWIGAEIGCRVIPLQLIDTRYYHLDTCFCPLSPTEAIYFPAAFDDYGRRAIEEHVQTLITVSPEEAARFSANAVVLGKNVILNTGCPQLESDLRGLGYDPTSTELGEFIKAGGSAKCLTLRLDGEDAAIWP